MATTAQSVSDLCLAARAAARTLAATDSATREGALHAIADGVQKQIKLNLYEQGAIVCVGQVEGSAPRSCYDAKQLANGLQNSTVYKTLPLVSVVPLARVY